ncbi:MAG: transposase [Bacteroidota bacterium]|nr:transposase [Bacteroidota bacterium]
MSEKYKTSGDGLYFVTLTVVAWLDVFTRREYQEILIENKQYCQKNKNLKIFCYCIMPSHLHFVTYSEEGELSNTLRDFKSYTAKVLMKSIENNPVESRKEFMIKTFEKYGALSAQDQKRQFWKHDNHAFFLYTQKMIQQKCEYIHQNPVEAGFVNRPEEWRMSSANDQSPIKLDDMSFGWVSRAY